MRQFDDKSNTNTNTIRKPDEGLKIERNDG